MRVGVLGAGLMGAALVETLLRAGHEVHVWNRTVVKLAPLVAQGAVAAETPVAAITATDATFVVLADGQSIRDVLLGEATQSSLAGRRLISVTTTSADEIGALASAVAANGGRLSEVSITVYPDQVRDRQGQYLLGCGTAEESFWTELLQPVASYVRRVGDIGSASAGDKAFVASYALNVTAAVFTAALGVRMGLPADVLKQQLTANSTIGIAGAEHVLPQVLSRTYSESLASIDSMIIALEMLEASARSHRIPGALIDAMLSLYRAAAARGLGAKDVAAVYEVLVEEAAAPNA